MVRRCRRSLAHWSRRLPQGVLGRVRLAVLSGCVVTALVSQLLMVIGSRPVGVRLAGALAVTAVVAWFLRGYRRGGFPARTEPLEVLFIPLMQLAVGDITVTMGLLFFALLFRSMYGGWSAASVRIALYIAATIVAAVLDGSSQLRMSITTAPNMVVVVVFCQLLVSSIERHDRATARERLLTRAGAAMQSVTDRAGLYQLTVDTAVALLHRVPGVHALLATVSPDASTVTAVAVAGARAEGLLGMVVRTGMAPTELAQAIRERCGAFIEHLSAGAGSGTEVVVPVQVGDELAGVLIVANARGIDEEARSSMDNLCAQLALRLDGVGLMDRLTAMAFQDPLTGLANRALIGQHLTRTLAESDVDVRAFALLLLDLDGFKQVNDSFGHEAGDEVLIAVAARLRSCIRPGDVAARLGGDEFAVVVHDVRNPTDIIEVAQRIRDALVEPIPVPGRMVSVRSSIGVAMPTSEVAGPGDLLRNADVAMYQAKRSGTGMIKTYEPGMHAAALRRLQLAEDIRHAPSGAG